MRSLFRALAQESKNTYLTAPCAVAKDCLSDSSSFYQLNYLTRYHRAEIISNHRLSACTL
eukprot:4933426-Karenia_brevis.AAC.1